MRLAGGGYFYLDEDDRAVIPTTTCHVLVVAERGDAFAQEADFDLTAAVGLTDQVISALPAPRRAPRPRAAVHRRAAPRPAPRRPRRPARRTRGAPGPARLRVTLRPCP
jgi:hypothetical protein